MSYKTISIEVRSTAVACTKVRDIEKTTYLELVTHFEQHLTTKRAS